MFTVNLLSIKGCYLAISDCFLINVFNKMEKKMMMMIVMMMMMTIMNELD